MQYQTNRTRGTYRPSGGLAPDTNLRTVTPTQALLAADAALRGLPAAVTPTLELLAEDAPIPAGPAAWRLDAARASRTTATLLVLGDVAEAGGVATRIAGGETVAFTRVQADITTGSMLVAEVPAPRGRQDVGIPGDPPWEWTAAIAPTTGDALLHAVVPLAAGDVRILSLRRPRPATGRVHVRILDAPEDASVTLDGADLSVIREGSVLKGHAYAQPGRYVLRVMVPGAPTIEHVVDFASGAEQNVVIRVPARISPPPPPPPPSTPFVTTGSIVVRTATPDVTILIDGEALTGTTRDGIAPGRHTLRVKKAGHRAIEQTVEIQAGKTLEVTLPPLEQEGASMPARTDCGTLATTVPGAPDRVCPGDAFTAPDGTRYVVNLRESRLVAERQDAPAVRRPTARPWLVPALLVLGGVATLAAVASLGSESAESAESPRANPSRRRRRRRRAA